MNVVERCPNCGTTQAAPGECEACHEAQVRYFCTNHEPGIWLAGPRCPQCEARAAAPPAPPRPMPRPPTADVGALEVRPPPLWKKLLGAALARRETVSVTPTRGWFVELVRRLAIVAVLLLAALIAVVYLVVHSLR